jgi:hypothetical protein
MSETYIITDLNGYVSQMREVVAQNICENYKNSNLDDYISISQIIELVKSECLGFDDNNRPILNEQINENIFEKISVWIYNASLSKLASQGFIECAWDNKRNEMIFWHPSNSEKPNESKSKSGRKNSKNKRPDN